MTRKLQLLLDALPESDLEGEVQKLQAAQAELERAKTPPCHAGGVVPRRARAVVDQGASTITVVSPRGDTATFNEVDIRVVSRTSGPGQVELVRAMVRQWVSTAHEERVSHMEASETLRRMGVSQVDASSCIGCGDMLAVGTVCGCGSACRLT